MSSALQSPSSEDSQNPESLHRHTHTHILQTPHHHQFPPPSLQFILLACFLFPPLQTSLPHAFLPVLFLPHFFPHFLPYLPPFFLQREQIRFLPSFPHTFSSFLPPSHFIILCLIFFPIISLFISLPLFLTHIFLCLRCFLLSRSFFDHTITLTFIYLKVITVQELVNEDEVVLDVFLADLAEVGRHHVTHLVEELEYHGGVDVLLGDGSQPDV